MRSSPVINSIFTQPPPVSRRPSAVVVSFVLHCLAFVWLYIGLGHLPHVDEDKTDRRFAVRVLRQDDIEYTPKKRAPNAPAARSGGSSSGHSGTRTAAAAEAAPAPEPARLPTVPPDLSKILSKTRTLIQPDAPQDVKLLDSVPIPLIAQWTPDISHDKMIVLPTPEQATAALAKPTIKPPNHEKVPAAIKIASSAFATKMAALPPSTTSPLVVRRPDPVSKIPHTSAKASAPPTPVRIVSMSDLQSKAPIIPIPAANSVARMSASPTLATGRAESTAQAANGDQASKQKESGAGPGAGNKPTPGAGVKGNTTVAFGTGNNIDKSAPGTGNNPDKNASGAGDRGVKAEVGAGLGVRPEAGTGTGQAPVTSAGGGGESAGTHYTVPKDGQYGVVVVGSSLAEQYPETVTFWTGRLIYTVYLHVGPGKSWILQYSLPRDPGQPLPAGTTRPDAPWPFEMTKPKLTADDFNSDAIMVHGFVNTTGKFEKLSVVFPTEFQKSKLILNALQQWQFRPAKENGQVSPVEVLLIIPEITE